MPDAAHFVSSHADEGIGDEVLTHEWPKEEEPIAKLFPFLWIFFPQTTQCAEQWNLPQAAHFVRSHADEDIGDEVLPQEHGAGGAWSEAEQPRGMSSKSLPCV